MDAPSRTDDGRHVNPAGDIASMPQQTAERTLPATKVPETKTSRSQWIQHTTTRSKGKGLFVTAGAYVIDFDAGARPGFSSKTQDLVLIFVGIGDFTPDPQPLEDKFKLRAPLVPSDFRCHVELPDSTIVTLDGGVAHTNGTAYQGVTTSREVKFFGERGIWVSCPMPRALAERLGGGTGWPPPPETKTKGRVKFTSSSTGLFDSDFMEAEFLISSAVPSHEKRKLTLCSSALWGLTGSRWLMEWIEYHKAIGFDAFELYVHEVGELTERVVESYRVHEGARIHDWTRLQDNAKGFNDMGVGRGVFCQNFEHAQRFARTDCYLRNRARSEWVGFIDVDEAFCSPSGNFYRDAVLGHCAQAYARDPMKVACSFTSVTVPPVATWGTLESLFLERIRESEASCQPPYNCGRYHEGREKYLLRTGQGAVNPGGPIFYHAVSQDYNIADQLHTLVDEQVGYVRHYAGHFKHSRMGGFAPGRGKDNPLPTSALEAVRTAVFFSPRLDLRKLYAAPQAEHFLTLRDAENKWRFAKPNDPTQGPPKRKGGGESSPPPLLTFDAYGGRLNNQFWTLDWVVRASAAFRRVAIIPQPREREHWIGFPLDSVQDEGGFTLWDVRALRSGVERGGGKIMFEWEFAALSAKMGWGDVLEEHRLAPACTWTYAPDNKYLMLWAEKAHADPQCAGRIHFKTSMGLMHSYKTDTRRFGVDPFLFWRHMHVAPHIAEAAEEFLTRRGKGGTLGLHARTWREAHGKGEDHAVKVCSRLQEKFFGNAKKRVGAMDKCANKVRSTCRGATGWSIQAVDDTIRANRLDAACRISNRDAVLELVGGEAALSKKAFIVATDHETKEADDMLAGLGGFMFPYPVNSGLPIPRPRVDYESDSSAPTHGLGSARSLRLLIEPILVDLHLMIAVDTFVGSPASTMSQAVCMWRMSRPEFVPLRNNPDLCTLVWLSTFGDDCRDVELGNDCLAGALDRMGLQTSRVA